MDYQPEGNFDPQYRSPVFPGMAMQTAATVLSIIAIATSCCIYSALICGALSIILAALSRGDHKKLNRTAKNAVVVSVIAIVFSLCMTTAMFASTIQEYGSLENFYNSYTQMLEPYLL
ncbi:MAG: hypothetical protein PUD20_00240 [bacterium]|nr:hypothetical protein [bacterium]